MPVVVGTVGVDIPWEFFHCLGVQPLPLAGQRASADARPGLLETVFGSQDTARFDAILDRAPGLDGLVLTSLNHATARFFHYLRHLHRAEPERELPMPHFFDAVLEHRPHCRDYTIDQGRRLLGYLEGLSGRRADADGLGRAVDASKSALALCRKAVSLREGGEPRVSGSEVLGAVAPWRPLDEQLTVLTALVQRGERRAPLPGLRLVVTGSDQEDAALYGTLEALGFVVVGEDHAFGSRLAERSINGGEPVEAIVDSYRNLPRPSAHTGIEQRVGRLLDTVERTAAQAVLFFVYEADSAPLWDYPECRAALQARRIPSLLLAGQPFEPGLPASVIDTITSFRDRLTGPAANRRST